MTLIELINYGKVLSTRDQGAQIRQQIENILNGGENVIITFKDTEVVSPSFIDECIGLLLQKYGPNKFKSSISLAGADEATRQLVTMVLSNRHRRMQELNSESQVA